MFCNFTMCLLYLNDGIYAAKVASGVNVSSGKLMLYTLIFL